MCKKTFGVTDGQGQRGAAVILVALLISMAGLGTTYALNQKAENSNDLAVSNIRSTSTELAASTAAELVAQLAGSKIVRVQGGAFVQAGGIGELLNASRLVSSPTQLKPVGPSGQVSWYLNKQNGKIYVNTCMRPPGGNNAGIFSDNNDVSWVKNPSGCDENYAATTEVTPTGFIAADPDEDTSTRGNIANAGSSAYTYGEASSANFYEIVRVNMKTTLSGEKKKSFTRTARVAFNDVSKVCSSNNAGVNTGCYTDHCPFMKPAKLDDGSIWYQANGQPYLVPNEKYSEALHLAIDFSAHQVNFDPNSGETPMSLINYYNESFSKGRLNPFLSNTWQGVSGGFLPRTFYISFIPNTQVAVLNVPMEAGPKGPGNVEFSGYLFKPVPPGDGSFNSSGSGNWHTWPYVANRPYTYPELHPYLKWGCARTVGDQSPDYCTKINVTYAKDEYKYPYRRQCKYRIPEDADLPSSLSGFRKEERDDYLSVSSTTEILTDDELEDEYDDDRTVWQDPYPHTPFNWPGNQSMTPVKHVFPDLKVGQRKIIDYRFRGWEDGKRRYDKKTITEYYDVSCTVESWNSQSSSYKKDLTACVYIKNYNIFNRSQCDQVQIPVLCRNGDGCFAGDTQITMADGSIKLVKDIKVGDLIRNPVSLKPIRVGAVSVGDELKPLLRIVAGGKEIKVTEDHPLITRRGTRPASDVGIADELMSGDGLGWHRVETVTPFEDPNGPLVYNLALDKDDSLGGATHLVVANGLASGDLMAQTSAVVRTEIDRKLKLDSKLVKGTDPETFKDAMLKDAH